MMCNNESGVSATDDYSNNKVFTHHTTAAAEPVVITFGCNIFTRPRLRRLREVNLIF